jgi:tripartite-type tricarboxylate transporter receptor subunit TctC
MGWLSPLLSSPLPARGEGARAPSQIAIVTAALIASLTALPAFAQTFPSRTITLVVGYAPGGTGDFVARLLSTKLSTMFGQTVVVENRAGASGAIAAQSVAAGTPDGHTLLAGQTPEIAINPHWLKGNLDIERDLVPIALGGVVPLALVVPSDAPYSTMSGLLDAAHTAKGLLFASAGTGTPGHLAGEYLSAKLPGKLVHVPYKGAGPALNDIIGGHVDMYFPGFPPVMPMMKAGTVKVLAVSSGVRAQAAPEIPTVAEATGFADFDFTLWQGFFAPKGTPKETIARLNSEINKILTEPETRQKLLDAGANVTPLSIEQFAAFVAAESAKYERIIRETGVKPE